MHKAKNTAYSLTRVCGVFLRFLEVNMENIDIKQTLTLECRKKLTIDGIINVNCFNDDYLELSSKLGIIGVEGENLKIEELIQETGKIYITGSISGVFYKQPKNTAGLFGKIFK